MSTDTDTDPRKELLARRLAAAGLARTAPRVRERHGRTDFPLSAAQHRAWLRQQIRPDSVADNLGIEIGFEGDIGGDELAASFRAVVRAHEVLRTTYHEGPDGPMQRVHADLHWDVERLDLRGRPGEHPDPAAALLARPFDLGTEGPLRVLLVRESDTRLTAVVVVHHIAWDGPSFAVLCRELAEHHRGVPPSPRPAQVADLAAGQEPPRAADREYWLARLGEPAEPLFAGLAPEDRGADVEAGRRVDRRMPRATAEALRATARALDTTPYLVVLAAYTTLLARIGSTGDVSVGTVVVNREDIGADGLVGNFTNLVVLRTAVPADDTFRGLVARTAAVSAEAREHARLPFAQLVEDLAPERDGRGGVLFDAVLDFLDQNLDGPTLPGCRTWSRRIENPTAQQPLVLEVFLTADGLVAEATFATSRLSSGVVSGLLADLEAVLLSAAEDPERTVAALLADLAVPTPVEPPAAAAPPVAEVLRERFASRGRAPALVAGDEVVTYAALGERVATLAARLRAAGAGPEVRVAVALPRSVDLVVALLAVLDVGAVVVPVDVGYPADRVRAMLEDSAPACVLALPEIAAMHPAAVALDVSGPAAPTPVPAVAPLPDNAAFLLFTSGSTGRPKGVLGTYAGLSNRLAWADEQWPVEPGDTRLAKSSVSFVDGLTELLAALLGGARVVLADDRAAVDLTALGALLTEHRTAQLTVVPSVLDALAEVRDAEWTGMRRWICSGEPLGAATVARAAALAPGSVVVNSYGSSEVVGDVLAGETDLADDEVVVGRAVPGAEVLLLDRLLQPVPVGHVGELYVGGVQVGRGYVGRPGETAGRFVADPRGGGGRLYRTGDLARRRADGRTVVLGRADAQVKIRGVRVEPAEVEAVLTGRPDVARAVVVARDDGSGPRLVGYLVAADSATTDPDQVHRWLRERLPAQLVPDRLTVLDQLPTTPSGKLDRRALPAPHPRSAVVSSGGREGRMCRLFESVLGSAVGPHEDFFAAGGHSLSALRLVNRIRADVGATLTVADVFAAPTPAALAGLLDGRPADAGVPAPPLLGPRACTEPVLSPGQLQMWALGQVDGETGGYVVPRVWEVDGPVDAQALEAALADLLDRHEILRTTYPAAGGAPVPRVQPAAAELLRVRRLTDPAEVDALVRLPFDLATELPVRCGVLSPAPDRHVVVLAVHHIAVDEWSYRLLLTELSAAYAARRAGREPDLGPRPLQYADVAAWQAAVLDGAGEGAEEERQLRFWADTLAGAPPETTFPPDRTGGPGGGAEVACDLPPDLTARLDATAEEHGVSLFMLLHAAVAVLLNRHGAGDEPVIGSPMSLRRDAAAEHVVGYLLTTLPLRVDLAGDPTVAELLARVRRADLAAFAHSDVPFARIVEHVRPDRAHRNPLFQVELVILPNDVARSELELAGADVRPLWTGNGAAKFDVTFQFFRGTGPDGRPELRGSVEYATDRYSAAAAAELAARLRRLLEQFAARPTARLGELRVLSSGDELRLLDRRRRLPVPAGRPAALAEVFARAVEARPDAVALVAGADRLTYRALAERVRRVAAALVARGVQPGDRVAIAVPRSADMVVAVLGVTWAGATYVPLDVASPVRRLTLILDDAVPHVVLTTREVAETLPRTPAGSSVLLLEELPTGGDLPARPAAGPAYVLYTSGSTGVPKGVEVPHRAVLDMLDAVGARMDLTPSDVWTLFHSVAFDFSVFEMWGAFGTAARLVVVDDDTARSPDALWRLVAAEEVSVLSQTPSAFSQVAHAQPGDDGARSLRYVVFGGETLDPRRLGPWFARNGAGGPRMINMYGITETTVHVTSREILPADAGSATSPVGPPLPGLGVLVLDERLRLSPPGVVGEVYVVGGQLAQGYLGKAGLTATRFVANPFGTGGERMYRSGDRARWTADGELEFAGRADAQVKVRGYRIEPGEIVAALLRQPEVGQAVVVLRGEDPDRRRLVGYVVADPASTTPVEGAVVRERLRESVPDYMVPAAVLVVDRIPLTLNGKLDVAALPEPDFAGAATGRTEPVTPAERDIQAAYHDVLGLPRAPGLDEDFFSLGGDSILAIRLVARLREGGLRLDTRDVFGDRTVAALASRVARAADPEEAAPPVRPVPLWYWLVDRAPDPRRGWSARTVEVPAGRSSAALAEAVRATVERHDALRLVLPPDGVPTLRATCGGDDPEEVAGGDLDQVVERTAARLDPTAGRMLAVTLRRGDGGPDRLVVAAHETAVDSESWEVLLAELEAGWTGRVPEPVGVPLAELTGALAEQATGRRHLPEFRRWSAVLSSPDALAALDPGTADGPAEVRTVPVPEAEGADELLAIVLAGLAVAVAQLGQGGLLADVERSLRADPTLTGAVGRLTTVSPVALAGTPDPAAALAAARAELAAAPDAGVGFGLLRHLHPQVGPRLARLPRPRVMVRLDPGTAPAPVAGYALVVSGDRACGAPRLRFAGTGPVTAAVLEQLTTTWNATATALAADRNGAFS
ncbi:amino acid adenylation domain-containing protein [Pseudonocardia xishanensis]|uniref:Carrier domain-containing protein n=1 Tax=Pseudonocardia xishanensis TaxID=630995 RepID=A0ABP8RUS5_9PSEU